MSNSWGLSDRDVNILTMVSRLGFLTERQICTLFYSKHYDLVLEPKKARNSLAQRIMRLVNYDFLVRGVIPSAGPLSRVAYLLGPAGAEVVGDPRDIESRLDPRWFRSASNNLIIRSRHDLITTNFLVNLMMLSRVIPDFGIVDWVSDRNGRLYIPQEGTDKKLVLHPDLYLVTQNGSEKDAALFLEIDRGTLDRKALGLKVLRFLQYYVSKKFMTDLNISKFPRVCFLVPDKHRLQTIQEVITYTKKHNSRMGGGTIVHVPFWISTFDLAEVDSIEKGFVSTKPLEPVWFSETGATCNSPLLS